MCCRPFHPGRHVRFIDCREPRLLPPIELMLLDETSLFGVFGSTSRTDRKKAYNGAFFFLLFSLATPFVSAGACLRVHVHREGARLVALHMSCVDRKLEH